MLIQSRASHSGGAFALARRANGDYRGAFVRCPNHPAARHYQTSAPLLISADVIWFACQWCDACGHVRGRDADYDPAMPQPHPYTIRETSDAQLPA